jgi:hypothetical protein
VKHPSTFLTAIFRVYESRSVVSRKQVTDIPVDGWREREFERHGMHRVDNKDSFHHNRSVERTDDPAEPIAESATVRFANVHQGINLLTLRQPVDPVLVELFVLRDPTLIVV